MAKRKDDSTEIQRLLEEKAQVEQWLEKIRAAGSKTPPSVRAKVESDYRQRLDAVMSELGGHTESLTNALAEEIKRRDQLTVEESKRATELAEAELRFTVGEYDDAKWEQVRGTLQKAVDDVRDAVGAAEDEIARLEEILRVVEGGAPEPEPEPVRPPRAKKPGPAPAPEVEEPDLEEPDIEVPVAELPDEIEAPPVEVEPVVPAVDEIERDAEPSIPRASQQTDAFDEMEFLRSVTEDERQGPAPARASGAGRLSSQDLVSPVDDIAPESGGTESLGGEEVREPPEPEPAAVDIGAEGVTAIGEQKGRPTTGTPQSRKTVKCGECGALNLPTEWYCERCGAELASL